MKPGTTSGHAPCTGASTPSRTGTQPTSSHSTPGGRRGPQRPKNSPPSSGRRRYSRRSAGSLSPLPSTPCCAATRRTPRPRQRTCNGRRHQSGHATHVPLPPVPATRSHPTLDTPGPPPPTYVLPTVRRQPATYHPTEDPPPSPYTIHRAPHHHHTHEHHSLAHTPVSMRTPQASKPPRHHPSTGTANRQPLHAPSVYANGCHRRPCPATGTTGSARGLHTASSTAFTAGSSTPTTARSPQPQPPSPPRQPPKLLRASHRHP